MGSITLIGFGLILAINAQNPEFWDFQPPQPIVRCAPTTAPTRAARRALVAFQRRLLSATDDALVGPLLADFHALLKTECFHAAAEISRLPHPDSALAFKDWWRSGGQAWLFSYVEVPLLGNARDPQPHVVGPPDVRKTLTSASSDHPLRTLLCPVTSASCGAETRGWALRADAFFERFPQSPPHEQAVKVVASEEIAKACTASTNGEYGEWRACVESSRVRRVALPLTPVQAPTSGWLIVSGRRGHYEFCDDTTAFDVATGAMIRTESCSSLALRRDGSVDRGRTAQGRRIRTVAGRVNTENLREALWMILLRGETERVQLQAAYYPVPSGMEFTRFTRSRPDERIDPVWFSTSWGALTWEWIRAGDETIAGELLWPESFDAAEAHATSLLMIAEASLIERCVAVEIPQLAPPTAETIRLNDVSLEAVNELRADFRAASKGWKSLPRCAPSK